MIGLKVFPLSRVTSARPNFVRESDPHPSSLRKLRRLLSFEVVEEYHPPPDLCNKKTLVLDMDETLIHSSNFPPHDSVDYIKIGNPEFYVFKRPQLDEFLQYITKEFEVFIFTFAEESYAKKVLDIICPQIDNEHRLYRDSCIVKDGRVIKDLSKLKRDPKKIIFVDDSKDALKVNPKNVLQITRWKGTPRDHTLMNWLVPILQQCVEAEDARDVIATADRERLRRFSF